MNKSVKHIAVAGNIGAGKTTLCRALSEEDSLCTYAISCTTRTMREGEVDGTDYHFFSEKEFMAKVEQGDFLEHARVHDHLYGTLKSSVYEEIEKGRDVLMDIDVQGADFIRENSDPVIQASLVDVFVMPPSQQELEARLGGRGTESDQDFALRMKNAQDEMEQSKKYAYTIISGTREEDLQQFRSIIDTERKQESRFNFSPQD